MSTCNTDMPGEQLCYIPCNFCNIVLAVSVPWSSMREIVTVRCGHCTNLWSLNLASVFSSPPSSWPDHVHPQGTNYTTNNTNYRIETGGSSSSNYCNKFPINPAPPTVSPVQPRVVKRPPEKRQRVPSAYNQFIKEEIQRIKANNPDISHREAFSTAAKNWAHFPHIHFGLMLDPNHQPKLDQGSQKHLMPRAALLNN